MLLNTSAALQAKEVDEDWSRGIRTRIHAGLFDHLTEEANRPGPDAPGPGPLPIS
jgi:hypothetical protein